MHENVNQNIIDEMMVSAKTCAGMEINMKSTLRRTWAEIDLDALAHNYKTLRKRIGDNVKFLGVVKADAYGHGSVQVSRLLEEVGELIKNNITQAVTCKAKALEYSEEAVKYGGILKIHIKVDTGMSRLGYLCDGEYFDSGVEGICEGCLLPGLMPEGIFTHFAVSDEQGDECKAYTKHQFELFTSVIDAVEKKLGRKFAIRHCANTGAVARYPETWLDMVRPGLLLYGYGEFANELDLKPVMSLKTTVSTIKTYPQGTAISYGGIYKTDKKTRIGVVPYGYADGFFRCLSNRYELMTSEGLAPQRGKICMDMCMIDLTDKTGVDVGSEVEIFGKKNPIEKMAKMAGTIPYELTCAVSKRVPRKYIKNGEVVEQELMLRG